MLAKYKNADIMKNSLNTKHSDRIHSLIARARMLLTAATIAILAAGLTNCSHSELWNEMPSDIASFVSHYFPNSELNSYSHSGNTYHVRIDDGPGLTFGANYAWIAIDGYGMPMPQVLLFDQLPPKLYDYLQETEQLNSVFSMERDKDYYTLTLLDSMLRYTIATGAMTMRVERE